MSDFPTIAIPQPTLPSPLPTAWQELMDCFYVHWQSLSTQVRANNAALAEGCDDVFVNIRIPGMLRSPHQDEIAAVMPPKVNAAVVLGNWNYQIFNGGHSQWDDNGYSAGAPNVAQLLTGAVALRIADAKEALDIVETFMARKEQMERDRSMELEDDVEGNPYDDLDTRLYAIDTETLGQAVLDRFEDILAASFRPVMKKAA